MNISILYLYIRYFFIGKELFMKLKAFTMAEVLITLGILGVVIAMTLPALIGHYQKKVTVEKLKTIYSKLSEVIKISETDNGVVNSWDYTLSSDEFVKIYLAPYIKNFKINNSVWNFRSLNKATWGGEDGSLNTTEYAKFSLANGTLVAVRTSAMDNGTSIIIYADTNGLTGPNVIGHDIFRMSITKTYGFTLGADRSDENSQWSQNSETNKNRSYLLSADYGTCNLNATDQFGYSAGDGCSLLIILDGWKISDDYPWNYKK